MLILADFYYQRLSAGNQRHRRSIMLIVSWILYETQTTRT